MNENSVAKVLRGIGATMIGIGALALLILLVTAISEEEWLIFLYGVISFLGCFISGMMFVGFAEIIDLLQSKLNRTYDILAQLSGKTANTATSAHRDLVHDIEASLPEL